MPGFKRIAVDFIRYWWLPPLCFVVMCHAIIDNVLPVNDFNYIVITFLFFWTLASIAWQIFHKKWLIMAIQIVLLVFCIFLATVIAGFVDDRPDHFADSLIIPEDLPYVEPLGDAYYDNPMPETCDKEKLLLIHHVQPGIYRAAICVETEEPGIVFLRAYEVTTLTPLSASTLKKSTSLPIGAKDKTLLTTESFTIYEGDWGKPYLARFEVWFAPASGRQEQLLTEKVHKIEGWMP